MATPTVKEQEEEEFQFMKKLVLIETLFNQLDTKYQWEVLHTLGDYLNVRNFE